MGNVIRHKKTANTEQVTKNGLHKVADHINVPLISTAVVEGVSKNGCDVIATLPSESQSNYDNLGFIGTSTNPFIVFFLRLRNLKPRESVTKIARVAGRRWQGMSDEQRQKYVDIARAEKTRRDKQNKRRKRKDRKFRSKRASKR